MPSRQRQAVKIINLRRKNTNENYYFMIAQRTGFIDVTVANQRFYYNEHQSASLDQKDVLEGTINSARPRRTITITRKGG